MLIEFMHLLQAVECFRSIIIHQVKLTTGLTRLEVPLVVVSVTVLLVYFSILINWEAVGGWTQYTWLHHCSPGQAASTQTTCSCLWLCATNPRWSWPLSSSPSSLHPSWQLHRMKAKLTNHSISAKWDKGLKKNMFFFVAYWYYQTYLVPK